MASNETTLLIVAIASLLLVLIAGYIAISLVRVLKRVDQTLSSFQKQIDDLGSRPKHLINNINAITDSVNHKMKCLDPLFHTFSNLGEGFEKRTLKYRKREEDSKMDQMVNMLDFAIKGVSLWNKMKDRS